MAGGSERSRTRVAVIGAGGRMGTRIVSSIANAEDMEIACSIVRTKSTSGKDDGTCSFASLLERMSGPESVDVDVAVEFTTANAIPELARDLARLGRPWISGTTGLDAAGQRALQTAADEIPVLWAPNMSLGVALLRRLVSHAAEFLPPAWQVEIVETHHPAKIDAPSGTALALADSWTKHRGGELQCGREGKTGPRESSEVGMHSLRLHDVVGEHRVLLGGHGETLELAHRALDRGAFVSGVLEAVRWIRSRSAGLYTLEDWVEDRLHRETGSE